MLELKTHNHKQHPSLYKGQYSERQIRQIFRVPAVGVFHNICNMCSWDLPDRSALFPQAMCVYIRKIPPAHVTYITYILQLWM